MIQNTDMTAGSTDFTTYPIARKKHNLRIPFHRILDNPEQNTTGIPCKAARLPTG